MITIQRLRELQKYIKISTLVTNVGLKKDTIANKMRDPNNSELELTVTESLKIEKELARHGIIITDIPIENEPKRQE